MKKLLTILSLLSVLSLTACEESEIKEASSKIEGFSHMVVSEEESQACTIHFNLVLDAGELIVYRNGVLHDPSLPNQLRLEHFPIPIMTEDTFSNDYYNFEVSENEDNEALGMIMTSKSGDESHIYSNIEIGEDIIGPYMKLRMDCQEGLRDLLYRGGNVDETSPGSAL